MGSVDSREDRRVEDMIEKLTVESKGNRISKGKKRREEKREEKKGKEREKERKEVRRSGVENKVREERRGEERSIDGCAGK